MEREEINHEYLPVLGLVSISIPIFQLLYNRLDAFTKAATTMLLGENSSALKEGRTMGIQVGGLSLFHSAHISWLEG